MSDEHPSDRRSVGNVERHLQTLLLSVTTAAILSLIAFVWRANESFARLDQRLISISQDLETVSSSMLTLANNSETKLDHSADVQGLGVKIEDHEHRLRDLEDGRRISSDTRRARR